jgi:hypothetical protein
MLGAADPAHLDNYSELIRSYDETFGPVCWPIIYVADTRCRSEEFDRIKRRLSINLAANRQNPLGFDVARPWNTVFKHALPGSGRDADKFWKDECETKCYLFLTSVRIAGQLLDEGTGATLPDTYSAPEHWEQRSHGASNAPRDRSLTDYKWNNPAPGPLLPPFPREHKA